MGSAAAAPTTQAQAPPVQAPPVQAPPAQGPLVQEPPVQQEPPKEEIPQEILQEVPQEEDPAASVTPEAQPSLKGKKARVEYRDENGNVLPESLVSSLRQNEKVKFETRFEYRSRLANGHEVDVVDGKVAPPHPDVEGQNPQTVQDDERRPVEDVQAPVPGDGKSSEESNSPEAKPASEGNEATES